MGLNKCSQKVYVTTDCARAFSLCPDNRDRLHPDLHTVNLFQEPFDRELSVCFLQALYAKRACKKHSPSPRSRRSVFPDLSSMPTTGSSSQKPPRLLTHSEPLKQLILSKNILLSSRLYPSMKYHTCLMRLKTRKRLVKTVCQPTGAKVYKKFPIHGSRFL